MGSSSTLRRGRLVNSPLHRCHEAEMSIAGSVLPEFDQEMATTRTMLERVPEARAKWTPHSKSRTLGELASHIGHLPKLGLIAMEADELDVAAPGSGNTPQFDSTANLLRTFDDNVKRARAAIEAASDSDMMEPWTLRKAGKTVWTLPRAAVLRSFILSHMIHHRGQLSVYLRLNDVPVPSVYGPSADSRV